MTHIAAAKQAAPLSGQAVTLLFNDNALMPQLLGDHDRHLVRLEQGFGVRLACRGNKVAISGAPDRVEAAQAALAGLWKRLERGEGVTSGDVDAVIRLRSAADDDPRLPLSDLPAIRTRRGAVGPRSPGQLAYMEALQRHEMVFALGPAGTGKTYLAVAQAVAMLMAGRVERIVLCRPAVEAGERLGFLPGDLREKVDPYLRPLYDSLEDLLDDAVVARYLERGTIEVAPLAYMRGRTLNDAFIILDEAQNASGDQLKMFLTRLGAGSRMVINGDVTQIDLPSGARSGLREAARRIGAIDEVGVVELNESDVVRHPLVAKIIKAYANPLSQ